MELRERIIEGASTLFRSYGIKSVTMDSLASNLGISKRTIYEVFSDKDELLIGVMQAMAERQKTLMRKIILESGNAIEAIFRILEINMNHMQEMSPAFRADIKRIHHEVLMGRYGKCEMPDYRDNTEVIIKGIEDGFFRSDLNADIVNRCFYLIGRSVMDSELFPFESFTRKEVLKNCYINYLRGISTQKGIDLINELEGKF
jgi:TetR/AcrR family transcriptional regulator, cholesterol catabolism regulator